MPILLNPDLAARGLGHQLFAGQLLHEVLIDPLGKMQCPWTRPPALDLSVNLAFEVKRIEVEELDSPIIAFPESIDLDLVRADRRRPIDVTFTRNRPPRMLAGKPIDQITPESAINRHQPNAETTSLRSKFLLQDGLLQSLPDGKSFRIPIEIPIIHEPSLAREPPGPDGEVKPKFLHIYATGDYLAFLGQLAKILFLP